MRRPLFTLHPIPLYFLIYNMRKFFFIFFYQCNAHKKLDETKKYIYCIGFLWVLDVARAQSLETIKLVSAPIHATCKKFLFCKVSTEMDNNVRTCCSILLRIKMNFAIFHCCSAESGQFLFTLLREFQTYIPKIPIARPRFQIPNSYSQNKFYNSMWSIFTNWL
jgi:hypothetical protein